VLSGKEQVKTEKEDKFYQKKLRKLTNVKGLLREKEKSRHFLQKSWGEEKKRLMTEEAWLAS